MPRFALTRLSYSSSNAMPSFAVNVLATMPVDDFIANHLAMPQGQKRSTTNLPMTQARFRDDQRRYEKSR
ncbi:hypothetical protein Poly59_37000 [Rubripirellula reticaptiva]|uniref:Uncharacterized protein n=1 Tax=Rubripirellula reticaptiva TaxID=2528013 RepID=A0A5C6ELT3_9BACT|nr:hypothetical protein Poly59_37000 [Rubripirellula reticaptiva]